MKLSLTHIEVSELPVGSIVFTAGERSNPFVVVSRGKLFPVSMLSERANGDQKPDGDAASSIGRTFDLITVGHGKIPTHKTAQRAAIEWLRGSR
jgi:hypothetical protein